MFWRSDYNEICATKGLKKENDPANSQIFWHLEMFIFWGGGGKIVLLLSRREDRYS